MKYLVEHHKPKSGAIIKYKVVEAESFADAMRVIEEWDMERKSGDTIFIYSQDGRMESVYVEDDK